MVATIANPTASVIGSATSMPNSRAQVRSAQTVPERLDAGANVLVPFHAGQALAWRFVGETDEAKARA
jgi:hypothetical protein